MCVYYARGYTEVRRHPCVCRKILELGERATPKAPEEGEKDEARSMKVLNIYMGVVAGVFTLLSLAWTRKTWLDILVKFVLTGLAIWSWYIIFKVLS